MQIAGLKSKKTTIPENTPASRNNDHSQVKFSLLLLLALYTNKLPAWGHRYKRFWSDG
jgi:hypothetical protein